MKFVLTSTLFSILALALPVLSLDPTIETVIDRLITTEFLAINAIPGLGLSIFNGRDNDPTMVRGYGSRNLEDQINTTPSTLFGIGSITKGFVGIMIAKTLSEKFPELGERALDTPIRQLLPSANFTLIDRFRSENVNFRDLVSHRLCLQPETLGLTTAPFKDKYEFLYRQRYAPEMCPFRTEFQYNNGAYALASELIAEIAGTTMEELLTQIFTDLEMTESTYFQEDVDYNFKANMSRVYYRNGTQIMRFNIDILKRFHVAVGAGGILSTPNDMLKYIQFYLSKGRVGDKQIISEEAMGWLGKSVNGVPFYAWKKNDGDTSIGDFGYGLGFVIGTQDGYQRLSHPGAIPPFKSLLSFFPAFNLGIFSAVNGPGYLNPESDLQVLHTLVFNILTGNTALPQGNIFNQLQIPTKQSVKMMPTVERNESRDKNSRRQKLAPTEIVGLYGNGLSGEFNVSSLPESETTGVYYFRYGLWGTGFMRPLTETTYQIEWDTDLAQEAFLNGPTPSPPSVLDFSETDQAILSLIGGSRIVFHKDLTLDKLPVQPWDPDTCGPTSTSLIH